MDLWHQLSKPRSVCSTPKAKTGNPECKDSLLENSHSSTGTRCCSKTFLALHESESFWDLEHLLDMAIHGDIFVLEFRQVEDIY